MKKYLFILLSLVLLTGCESNTNKTLYDKEQLTIVVTSDLHYFDPDLYKDCDWFEEAMLSGDGKMVHESDKIIDTFIHQMIETKPDLVIITGDLTFNGELTSHQKLAQKLLPLKENDIPVAVIPGNHDLNNFFAKGYDEEGYFSCDSTTLKQFKEIYQSLGLDLSTTKDKNSASYTLSLNDTFDLIMLDDGTSGTIKEETKNWLTTQLKAAKQKGKLPIIAMHHNLAVHNLYLNEGFTMTDNDEYAQLFKDYQVPFVLSGHIHCQSITEINDIYDIVTESLLVTPLQYGVIQLSPHHLNYTNQQLPIDLDSQDFFDKVSYNSFYDNLEAIQNEDEKNEILNTLILANRYYFSGNIYEHQNEILDSQGYSFIQQYQDNIPFAYQYIQSMLHHDDTANRLDIDF